MAPPQHNIKQICLVHCLLTTQILYHKYEYRISNILLEFFKNQLATHTQSCYQTLNTFNFFLQLRYSDIYIIFTSYVSKSLPFCYDNKEYPQPHVRLKLDPLALYVSSFTTDKQ